MKYEKKQSLRINGLIHLEKNYYKNIKILIIYVLEVFLLSIDIESEVTIRPSGSYFIAITFNKFHGH